MPRSCAEPQWMGRFGAEGTALLGPRTTPPLGADALVVLVPHHSRPRRSRRAGGAVSGWSLSRWWGNWRTTQRFGSPQKRTPWLNREVRSCRWRLRRHRTHGGRGTAESLKALLSSTVVGATGFEPVTSFVSANNGEALCYPPLSQVALNRRQFSQVLSWRSVTCSPSYLLPIVIWVWRRTGPEVRGSVRRLSREGCGLVITAHPGRKACRNRGDWAPGSDATDARTDARDPTSSPACNG